MNHRIHLTLIILLSFCFNIYARDFQSEANNMVKDFSPDSMLTEESARENIPNYEGTDKVNEKYKDIGTDLESKAREQESDNETSGLIEDVFYKSPKYEFTGNEDLLKKFKNNNISIIASDFEDCRGMVSDSSCILYDKPVNNYCQAERIIEVEEAHEYRCNKERLPYKRQCTRNKSMTCENAVYTLPRVIFNSLPGFSYHNNYINYRTPNRMGANCSGHRYSFNFHLDAVEQVEDFRFLWGQADDRTLILINGVLVHNYPNYGCELSRVSHSAPNINLRPYLRVGTNQLEVRIIIGGWGSGEGQFYLKYKDCLEFGEEDIDNCTEKRSEDDNCIDNKVLCVAPNETRNIDGFNVTKECWEYEVEQMCTASEFINHCDPVIGHSHCIQFDSSCVEKNDIGHCINYENKYRCNNKVDSIEENEFLEYSFNKEIGKEFVDSSSCDSLVDTIDCSFDNESCLDEGVRNIKGIDIERSCWKYKRQYTCHSKKGKNACTTLNNQCIFHSKQCLIKDDSEECVKSQQNYSCSAKDDDNLLFCGSQVYCENNNCDEIGYQRNTDFQRAASNLALLDEAAKGLDPTNTKIFTGDHNSCDVSAFSFNSCCKSGGWGNDAGLGSCSVNEKALQEKSKAGQCHYVGSYCSREEKLTGTCLTNTHSYCCFEGKLPRIIQQQSKEQLGTNWGTAKYPQCDGILLTDIERIRFEDMDFSEFFSNIDAKTTMPNTARQLERIESTINNFYLQYENDN